MKWVEAAPKKPSSKKPKAKAKSAAKAAASSKAKAKAKTKAQAKAKPSASEPAAETQEEYEVSETKFDLEQFIKKLWELAGLRPVSSRTVPDLSVGSSCSGSGSFEYVLTKMVKIAGDGGKKCKLVSHFGAENDKVATTFMVRNRRAPKCVFEDRICNTLSIMFSGFLGYVSDCIDLDWIVWPSLPSL